MSTFYNLVFGGAIAIAVVLAFWLMLGFVEDMRHEPERPPR
jgi:hypothetical protein